MLRGIRISQSQRYAQSRQMGRMVRAATGRASRSRSTTDAETSCDNLATELASLKGRLVDQADELRRLRRAPTADASTEARDIGLIDANRRLQSEAESLNERINEMKKLQAEMDTANGKLLKEIANLKAQRDADLTQRSAIESKIRDLSAQQEELSRLSVSMSIDAAEMDELDSRMKSIANDAKQKEEHHNKQMLELTSEKGRLDSRINDLEETLQTEKTKGSNQVKTLEEEIRKQTERKSALEKQVAELSVKLKSIKLDQDTSLRRLYGKFRKLDRASQAAHKRARDDKRRLGEEKRKLEARLEGIEGLKAQNAESKNTIEEKQKHIEELTSEISGLKGLTAECLKQKGDLESRIERLNRSLGDLSQLSDTDRKNKEEIERHVQQVQQKEQIAQKRADEYRAEIDELNSKKAELERLIVENERTITDLRSKMFLYSHCDQTTDRTYKEQLQSKDHKITELERTIQEKEALVERYKRETEVIHTDIQSNVANLEALNKKLEDADANHHTQATDHKRAITRLEKDLQEAREANRRLDGVIKGNTEKLCELEQAKLGLQKDVNKYTQELKEKDGHIQDANSKISELESELARLRLQLSKQESSDKQRVSELERRITDLTAQLDAEKRKLDDERIQYRGTIQDLEELVAIRAREQKQARGQEYETPTKQDRLDLSNKSYEELTEIASSGDKRAKEKAELVLETRAFLSNSVRVRDRQSQSPKQLIYDVESTNASTRKHWCDNRVKELEVKIKQYESEKTRLGESIEKKDSTIIDLTKQTDNANQKHAKEMSAMKEEHERDMSAMKDKISELERRIEHILVDSTSDAQVLIQQIADTEESYKNQIARYKEQASRINDDLRSVNEQLAKSTEETTSFRSLLCFENEDDRVCIDRILEEKSRIGSLEKRSREEANENGALTKQIGVLKSELESLHKASSSDKNKLNEFMNLCSQRQAHGECISDLKELLDVITTIKQRAGKPKDTDSPKQLVLGAIESDVGRMTNKIQMKLDEVTSEYTKKRADDERTINSLHLTIEQCKQDRGKIQELETQMRSLHSEKDRVNTELVHLQVALQGTIDENGRLTKSMASTKEDHKANELQLSEQIGKNKNLVKEIRNLRIQIEGKEQEIADFGTQISSLLRSLDAKQVNIDQLQGKLDRREWESDDALGKIVASYIDRSIRFRANVIRTLIDDASNLDEKLRNEIIGKFKELHANVTGILDDKTQSPVPVQKAESLRTILTGIQLKLVNEAYNNVQRSSPAPQNRRATGGLDVHSQSTSSISSAKSTSASPVKRGADAKKRIPITASLVMRDKLTMVLNSILDPGWVSRIPDLIKLKRFVDTYRMSEDDQRLLSLRAAYLEEPFSTERARIYKDITSIRNGTPVLGDKKHRDVGKLEEYINHTEVYTDDTMSDETLRRAMEYDDSEHTTTDLNPIKDYVKSVSTLKTSELGANHKRSLEALLLSTHILSLDEHDSTEKDDSSDMWVEQHLLESSLRTALSNGQGAVGEIDDGLIESIKMGTSDKDNSEHGRLKREIIRLINLCSSSSEANAPQLPVRMLQSIGDSDKKQLSRPDSAPLIRSSYGSYI